MNTGEMILTKIDKLVIMWLMLAAGVILICFAASIANAVYPPLEKPEGGYITRDAEVVQAILVCRCLGGMIFAAGLVERLVMSISSLSAEHSHGPALSSKPRHAWSMPDKPIGDSGTGAA